MNVEYNLPAFYELRRDPEIVSEIDRIASEVADSASRDGGEYGWESHQGRRAPQGRWRATVFTKDAEARKKNAENNSLLRGLGGG